MKVKRYAMQTRYETGGSGQHYIPAVDLRGFRVKIRSCPAGTVNPSVVEKQFPATHPISSVITSGINEHSFSRMYYVNFWIFLIVLPTGLFISLFLNFFYY
jgi:hypothetical protein